MRSSGRFAASRLRRRAWPSIRRIRTVIATLGRYPNVRSPDNVAVVSESSGKVQRVIPMGYYPNQLAVDPRSGNVYVPIVFKGIVTEFRL